MSQIKTRIIFKVQGDKNPLFSTDFDTIKKLDVPGEGPFKDFHEIIPGTRITLNNHESYEVLEISTDFFDTEYSNDGISMNNIGERYPYNFEVVYKVRKL